MIPHVLLSSDETVIQLFIDTYIKDHHIALNHVFNIIPESTEFSVNQIREIKKNIMFFFDKPRLYILKEFQKSSFEAQNAFLKTLEEHTDNIHFILSMNNQHALLPTIKSRAKIIILPNNPISRDEEIIKALNAYIEDNNGSIFQLLNIKAVGDNSRTARSIIDQLIYFFKGRLATDRNASKILSEVISAYYILENNHVDSQLSLDHILLSIKKYYI